MKRVLIVGTGALATLFAARLADSGCKVCMFGEWVEAVAKINGSGIVLHEDKNSLIQIRGVAAVIKLPVEHPFDVVLFLCKTYQNKARLATLTPWFMRCKQQPPLVLTLQNGIGNAEQLSAGTGFDVLAGTTTMAAKLIGPANVLLTGHGSIQLPESPLSNDLADLFRMAGFVVELSGSQTSLLWRKLLVNAVVNPITAIHRIPNGDIAKRSDLLPMVEGVVNEVVAICNAIQVDLNQNNPLAYVLDICRLTANNHSSMLTDVERGKPTEIEAITGEILRIASENGIPAPTNKMLYDRIKETEQKRVGQ